jgi:DGQHR domain-containing protein
VIIAIDENYAFFDADNLKLTIRNFRPDEDAPSINIRRVARVIDGQHRIAGLMKFVPVPPDAPFDVPVTVFVGADIADQAYIFSTVNLEQTKVSRSLAIDLYELARHRSPFKTCHNVAVALDRDEDGPLYHRIKRLGFATAGRKFEPITQATFVDGLIPYISADPKGDRDLILRGRPLERSSRSEGEIFRTMFIEGRDLEIARTVSEYFYAVRDRWSVAWDNTERGAMLNRTNGLRALMRALGFFYKKVGTPDRVVMREKFLPLLWNVPVSDADFTVENFPPGTSGEAKFRRILVGDEDFTPVPPLFE